MLHFELNPSAPTLLVIAHPGHELRVWGWVTSVRPLVSVLTDGSGSTGHPRLDVTRASLERIGARPESPFGPLTDRMVYTSLLTGEHEAAAAARRPIGARHCRQRRPAGRLGRDRGL